MAHPGGTEVSEPAERSAAAAYVTKPVGLEGLRDIVSAIDGFWFTVVRYLEE